MTLDEIGKIVALCTYKPGWSLQVFQEKCINGRMYLKVDVNGGVCSVSGQPVDWRGAKHTLSPFMCKQEIVGVCFKAIQQAEEHELREFFRYRGVRIFNPHIDPDALVTVAHIEDVRQNPMSLEEGQQNAL